MAVQPPMLNKTRLFSFDLISEVTKTLNKGATAHNFEKLMMMLSDFEEIYLIIESLNSPQFLKEKGHICR